VANSTDRGRSSVDTTEDRAFREEIRTFLEESLSGDFAAARGRGGPGDEHAMFDERLAWERHLGAHGWTCVGWPKEHGGRGLPLSQQMIYHEEYARARAPGRVGHIGEGLAGPTIIAFGTPEQQQRFLPPIVAGEELWCQGYSEPDAGSDLANVQTRAEQDSPGGDWTVTGQKVWTSLAHWAQWCFVLARTSPPEPGGRKHQGLSYLLVPMDQDGIEMRPIVQLTGDSEFNEVFFDGARTAADNVVGGAGNGWKVAMGTLAFERGASTLGQQLNFRNELDAVVTRARETGAADNPAIRQRLAQAHIGLEIMRLNALRTLAETGDDGAATRPELGRAAYIHKLYWAGLHRRLGELAMDVAGAGAMAGEPAPSAPSDSPGSGTSEAPPAAMNADKNEEEEAAADGDGSYPLTDEQRLFLFTRADTIYGGSDEIQRGIIGERALGLPKEPQPQEKP
jgi:alkylation response protein AidB-like acyl-CoA dehydrogenase